MDKDVEKWINELEKRRRKKRTIKASNNASGFPSNSFRRFHGAKAIV